MKKKKRIVIYCFLGLALLFLFYPKREVIYHAFSVTSSPVSDPHFPLQWAYYNTGNFREPEERVRAVERIDIGMREAWNLYNGGVRETIVAIIDTGIEREHEDLTDIFWVNEGEIAGDGIDNDENGYIDDIYGWDFYNEAPLGYTRKEDDHGTHGAGTIAANKNKLGIAGIAGNSTIKIMVLKVLGGKDGYGSTTAIVKAIEYAERNGAVICNLSFGANKNDKMLERAIKNSSMLFVAAMGNGNPNTKRGYNTDNRPIYPACYPFDNVIGVANLMPNGNLNPSSNYGMKYTDLAAPGTYIFSTTTNSTYSYMTGTSMAAPMVTGVAAMLYSMREDVTITDVKDIILNTVTPLDSLEGVVATGGMLNAATAVGYLTDDDIPPVIKALTWENEEGMKLTVRITDNNEYIKTACYLAGTKAVEDFERGTVGKSFSLNKKGQKTFIPTPGRTYTFYAMDIAGNETVFTTVAAIELN